MAELFVDMCAFCKQGVLKTDMDYQKGKVFHAKCFTEHGGSFVTPNSELASLSAKTRIELVQLKNMQIRSELEKQAKKQIKKKSSKKAKPKKKSKKAKAKAKAKGGKRKAENAI
ncbi:MAG: hypothetical protein ACT4NT_08165 [Nitrososphaerota archaeon]